MMHYISVFLLQTDSAGGNCLFAAITASMNVHRSNSKDAPYYPMRYFRRQVMAWMIKHHQLVVANKGMALMANNGLEEENDQFKGPLSFKQYLWHMLQCHFWGDEIILYAISCMWNLRIMVLNSRTLEDTKYGIVSLWLMQMWASYTTVGLITLQLVSVGCITGHIVIFYIGKLVTLLVSLYSCISGHLAMWSFCLPGQLISHFAFHCMQMKT